MPDLLLVGAGHAHLHLIAHAHELRAAGYAIRVLAPASFDYSGVASATAAGSLAPDAGRIDVRALTARHDVELVEGTLTGLDLEARVATTSSGATLGYDVLGLNLGSVVAVPRRPDSSVSDDVLRVKPLSDLAELAARLDDAPAASVTVIGGGSTGLELAAHLAARPGVAQVRLVEAGPQVGAGLPSGARRRLVRLLADRGVELHTDTAVVEATGRRVRLAHSGSPSDTPAEEVLAHDVALLATGLCAPPLVAALGLGDEAGIPVAATLQHVDHPEIYAAGDCAHFTPQPLARIGVHGVRQGPVLLASLLARADSGGHGNSGGELPTYSPRRRALAVLDLGGGVALATRGRLWWYGATALRLKRWIDRRWLNQYR